MASTNSAAHVRVIEETSAYWKVVFDYPPFNIVDASIFEAPQHLLARMDASPSLRVVVFESANPEFYLAHFDLTGKIGNIITADLGPCAKVAQRTHRDWFGTEEFPFPKAGGRVPHSEPVRSVGHLWRSVRYSQWASVRGQFGGGSRRTSVSVLVRNLSDVSGENDPVRRRAAVDGIFHEDAVFYDPKGGAFRGRDKLDRIAGVIKATHPDFEYQPLFPPEELLSIE
jgi:hypothetical protein